VVGLSAGWVVPNLRSDRPPIPENSDLWQQLSLALEIN
jgi:hypothetical protein